jgi:hypothetical protein
MESPVALNPQVHEKEKLASENDLQKGKKSNRGSVKEKSDQSAASDLPIASKKSSPPQELGVFVVVDSDAERLSAIAQGIAALHWEVKELLADRKAVDKAESFNFPTFSPADIVFLEVLNDQQWLTDVLQQIGDHPTVILYSEQLSIDDAHLGDNVHVVRGRIFASQIDEWNFERLATFLRDLDTTKGQTVLTELLDIDLEINNRLRFLAAVESGESTHEQSVLLERLNLPETKIIPLKRVMVEMGRLRPQDTWTDACSECMAQLNELIWDGYR